MKSLKLALMGGAACIALTGCGSVDQPTLEHTYTVAASGVSVGMATGAIKPDQKPKFCQGDTTAYTGLTSTRHAGDGADYTPANLAHGGVQGQCQAGQGG